MTRLAAAFTAKQRQRLLRVHRKRLERIVDYLIESLDLIDFKISFYDTWLAFGLRPKTAPPRKKVRGEGSHLVMILPREQVKKT